MKVEKAEWHPPSKGRGRNSSKSYLAILNIQPGETLRIIHDDLICYYKIENTKGSCGIGQIVTRLRRWKQWDIEYYHEKNQVAVIRRVK